MVGKRDDAAYKQFLLSPNVFKSFFLQECSIKILLGKGVNTEVHAVSECKTTDSVKE